MARVSSSASSSLTDKRVHTFCPRNLVCAASICAGDENEQEDDPGCVALKLLFCNCKTRPSMTAVSSTEQPYGLMPLVKIPSASPAAPMNWCERDNGFGGT